MPHIREKVKRFIRKGEGNEKKQPYLQSAAPSANSTPIDSTPAASNHIEQEQSRDSSFLSIPPASHQQLPAAKSLWDRAYDVLAEENSSLVKDYDELLAREQMENSAPDETTPSPRSAPYGLDTHSDLSPRQVQLNTVIRNGLQRMEDNKPTITIAGHEIVLADQITTAAKFLVWSKELIGSAVKNSPEASIVWSGVSLIIPLLTSPITADAANRDGFVYVTSRMHYYVALEPLLRRLGQNASVDEALISVANEHIVDLYQAVLEFQLSSVIRFYQSCLETYVHDIAPSKDWEQTRPDIEKLEGTVNNDLSQINGLVARQELDLLNETSERTRAIMESSLSVATQQLTVSKQQQAAQEDATQERLLASKQQQAAQEDARQERLLAKQQECLRELYLTQNGNGAAYDWYKDRVEPRVDGTCKWFLQHENFQKWLLQESGPLLVTADPGCGKSVLAKYLIDHELAQQSATICYFFFKDQDQNTVRQALCALLHQLFVKKEALIQHAMEHYNRMGADFVQSESSLWAILRDTVRDPQAGPVIFVVDALDECDESQLSSLMSNLQGMFLDEQLAKPKFKVLMTSRPYEQVVGQVYRSLQDDFPRIHIPGEEEFEAISREISIVIHYRVGQLAKKHRLSDKIKSSLERKLLAIDHRTYLWVYLVFDYLDKGFSKNAFEPTDAGINAAIQKLPKVVNQAYDHMLNRSQDNRTVEVIKKAFSIILAACRPLTLSEMNIAMNLDGHGRGQSIYSLDLKEDGDFSFHLRALCDLFVNIHHGKIYFFHQTAREFLIQSSAQTSVSSGLQWHQSITTRHAHSVLAEICMSYLDMLNSTPTETFRRVDQHGALLQYSVKHMGYHFREAEFEKNSVMVDLALGLCTPDLSSHLEWASIISRRYHIRPESSKTILVSSHLGVTAVTRLLLKKGADVEAQDSQGRTALMIGAESGHDAITQLLLENGADVEARDDDGMTALMHAAESNQEALTQLLLDNRADIEAKDNRGWTALMHAARSGHAAVTRLLSENDPDVEARDDDGWTALMHAARGGHRAVTWLLIESGADVKAKDSKGWTALADAPELTTQLLLDNGAR